MKQPILFYFLFSLFLFGCGGPSVTVENLELDRSEEAILEFERENQNLGARKGIILFLGSGPVAKWTNLNADLPGMPIKNRGFKDASLREVIHYFRRLTDPFQPELLVLYSGESDIMMGATPEQVLSGYKGFLEAIRVSNRTSRLVYISIMASPKRMKYWPEFQKANALIKQMAEENNHVVFVDINAEMMDADGKPIAQLFEADGLTLNRAGYTRWASALAPIIERMY